MEQTTHNLPRLRQPSESSFMNGADMIDDEKAI
jgi:hypothetical protein